MHDEIADLIAQLRSQDSAQRQAAAQQLASMQEQAQPAAVALVEACAVQGDMHEWVVAALESLGPPAAGDLDSLSRLLQSADLDTAYWAATLLGRLGNDGAAAVDALTKALANHAQTAVRERAAWALGEIGPAAGSARAALQAASSGSSRLARLASAALEQIG